MPLDDLPAASDADTKEFPNYLATLHKWMLDKGKKENTSKAYVRSMATLFQEDGRTPAAMASDEYFAITKESWKNKKCNGQRSAAVKQWMDFWRDHGKRPLQEAGENKLFTLENPARTRRSGTPEKELAQNMEEIRLRELLSIPNDGSWQVSVVRRVSGDLIAAVSPGGRAYKTEEALLERLGRPIGGGGRGRSLADVLDSGALTAPATTLPTNATAEEAKPARRRHRKRQHSSESKAPKRARDDAVVTQVEVSGSSSSSSSASDAEEAKPPAPAAAATAAAKVPAAKSPANEPAKGSAEGEEDILQSSSAQRLVRDVARRMGDIPRGESRLQHLHRLGDKLRSNPKCPWPKAVVDAVLESFMVKEKAVVEEAVSTHSKKEVEVASASTAPVAIAVAEEGGGLEHEHAPLTPVDIGVNNGHVVARRPRHREAAPATKSSLQLKNRWRSETFIPRSISFMEEPVVEPVASCLSLYEELWFPNPGLRVTCERCLAVCPQASGQLGGAQGRPTFAQSEFVCFDCVANDQG